MAGLVPAIHGLAAVRRACADNRVPADFVGGVPRPAHYGTERFECNGKMHQWIGLKRTYGISRNRYEDTRAKLKVDGGRLRSLVNGKSYGIGELELVSLQALRERVKSGGHARTT